MINSDYKNRNMDIIPREVEDCQVPNYKFTKRIGNSVYVVNAYFKKDNAETFSEKVLRIIKNDLQFSTNGVIMESPQTGGLLERSSA